MNTKSVTFTLIIGSVALLLMAGECKTAGPDCIWVYSKPSMHYLSEKEQKSASYIFSDQLKQLNIAGPVFQSSSNKEWYFMKNRSNDLYLISYLTRFGESYFLFVYAVDFISSRIVHGDYYDSKTIEGFKGITYWPIDEIAKYDIDNHQDMYSPKMKNVSIGAISSGRFDKNMNGGLYALMNIAACKLGKEKGLNIKTYNWVEDIVNLQDLLESGHDKISVSAPERYMHRLMIANFIYTITLDQSSAGVNLIELLEMIEVQSMSGFTADRKKSKKEIGKLELKSSIEHINKIADKICKIITEKAENYRPLPEAESLIIDEVTGETIEIIHKQQPQKEN